MSYVVTDSLTAPTVREEGEGVLTSGTPWTLTRATIRRSLNAGVAGSSAINWGAGTKYIWLSPLGPTVPSFDTDGYAGLGWQQIGGVQVATSLSTIDIALPSVWTAFRFTAWRLAPSVNSGVLWRISTDGGATYRAGASDYDTAFMFANSGTPSSGAGSAAQVDLTGPINATDNRSRLHIPVLDPGSGSHKCALVCQAGILDTGPTTRTVHVSGAAAANGRATHMRLLPSSGNLSCAYLLEGIM